MAEKKVVVRKNADGTITVRIGRQVEHFTTEGKSKADVFDAVKWSLITHGASLADVTLIELLGEYDR